MDRLRFETLADDVDAAFGAVGAPTGGEVEEHKLALALINARNALAEQNPAA